jgi:2-isopropylmalate synthase
MAERSGVNNYIYDWNTAGTGYPHRETPVEFDDETLRDGLQSPSVRDPSIGKKIELLHLMAQLGIHAADLGLPGAGPRARADIVELCREIQRSNLAIQPNCAVRTALADVTALVEIADLVGMPIEACTFIGSSPIRQYAEEWSLDHMLKLTEEAVSFAVKHGLPVMYVTEDTTRATPDTIRRLHFRHGGPHHAPRRAQPDSLRPATASGDWRGHQDRLARPQRSRLGGDQHHHSHDVGRRPHSRDRPGRGRAGGQLFDGPTAGEPPADGLHQHRYRAAAEVR